MRPFESSELRERLVPFLAPLLLAGVLVAAGAIPLSTGRAEVAAAIGVGALASALLVPWGRLPAAAQVLPPLAALVAVALAIAGSDDPGVSPLSILVIGPVLWLALYHEPAHLWVGVAGAGLAVAAGTALADQDPETSAAAAAVTIASCAVVGLMTSRLLHAERDTARGALQERNQHRLVLDHLPDTVIAHLDRDLRWVSLEGGAMSAAREDVIGRHCDETLVDGAELRAAYVAALDGAESRLGYHQPATGVHYDIQVLPVRDAGGSVVGAMSVARDVTAEKEAGARLVASEREHRLLTESSRDMISRHDLEGRFIYASAAARDLTGFDPDDLIGRPDTDIALPEDHALIQRSRTRLMTLGFAACEFRIQHRDGTTVWVEQRGRVIRDGTGEPVELHFTSRDVTGRREADSRLAHLATHDDLTGLWNRRRFNEALREELARAHRRGADAVMLIMDLDDFKGVNDSHGHETGDRMLVAVADAIRSRIREGDCAGRLGGDEFAVLLRGTAPEQAAHVAEEYAEAIGAASIDVGGTALRPQASVGAAVVSGEALDERTVLAAADVAMYRSKAARKGVPEAAREPRQTDGRNWPPEAGPQEFSPPAA